MKRFKDLKIRLSSILILLAIIGWSSSSFAQWQYSGSNIYYNGGNVGIGTSNLSDPDQLVISSDEHAMLRLKSTAIDGDSWRIMSQPSGAFVIRDEDIYADRITIIKNGNIGFGVSDPSEKLEINNGNIYLNNSNNGLILTSPDGTKWKITVDNSGNLTTIVTIIKKMEFETNNEINIFPNPSENIINIEIESQKNNSYDIEIYNVQGKLIFMKNYKSNSINIDISDLSNGTYILKIKDETGNIIKTEKIVKE